MKLAKYLRYCILLIPVVFLWGGFHITHAKYGNDPNYVYLANATAICDGQSVGYIDHPGTTVMQIGALTISFKHLFSNPENVDLVTNVLKNPLKFMDAIQYVLVVLNSLVLLLLGWIAYKKTRSLWAALLLQATTLISANTLDHIWTKVEPEPLLFFITCIYVITILYFTASENKSSYKFVFLFALITGFGLATKATFLPLVLFPLILFKGVKKKMIFSGSTVLSFLLFIIPAIPEYKHMYFWFRNLINRTGKYGHGEKGLIDFSSYFHNMLEIFKNNPIFFVVTVIGVLSVVLYYIKRAESKKLNKDNSDVRILIGLVASSILGVLIVSKHYIVHPNHYLIPVLLLTGITILFILKVLTIPQKIVLPVMTISLLLFLSFRQPGKIEYADYGYKITNEEIDSTELMLTKNYADYTRIYYYPYSLNKFSALNFGDVYTKNKMLPYLKELYPNTYFYNSHYDFFQHWNAEILLEDIIQLNSSKIILVGGPMDEKLAEEMTEKGFPLKKIYKGRIQAVYELDTLAYQQIARKKTTEEIASCGFETVDKNQTFSGLNNELFGSALSRTNEVAKSGQYSIKMDSNTEFAMEYLMDSLKRDELYEVKIWRKSDNNSARLVIGSTAPNVFYKSQNDYITSSGDGWDLLRINFQVTSEMEKTSLKVYLWNKDKKQAYFDDLSIERVSYN
ncbi:hypothetical protein SAMN05444274_10872 [Mariniphaga anaerophila]|uniref:Dolichyl-phosphate-mannose-protein mannosyltransferase n=1 Tax=Mariniphaga anaerophila TaxID=1484053 RepID=A0A1M5E455_9BACT|nr:hypothetical protein [Mariniphaga anaerophila]SHF73852.1 hypothetical protein SAMN05444274_10872 [Mariniphaga anaerophila]